MKPLQNLKEKAEKFDVPYFDTCVELAKYVNFKTPTVFCYHKHLTENNYKLDLFDTARGDYFGSIREANIVYAPTFKELIQFIKNSEDISIKIENNDISVIFYKNNEEFSYHTAIHHLSDCLAQILIDKNK